MYVDRWIISVDHISGANVSIFLVANNFEKMSKGHGNEADFLGFLQKLVPHRSLTLPFEPFHFWLRICRDILIEKRIPDFAS